MGLVIHNTGLMLAMEMDATVLIGDLTEKQGFNKKFAIKTSCSRKFEEKS